MADDPGPHSSNRVFEWVMGLAVFCFGFHLFLFPGSMPASRFSSVMLVLPPMVLVIYCLLVGLLRMIVLYKNDGLKEWGQTYRSILAIASACLWLQLGVALMNNAALDGKGSPGIPIYISLFIGEVRTVWRARQELNGSTRN